MFSKLSIAVDKYDVCIQMHVKRANPFFFILQSNYPQMPKTIATYENCLLQPDKIFIFYNLLNISIVLLNDAGQ